MVAGAGYLLQPRFSPVTTEFSTSYTELMLNLGVQFAIGNPGMERYINKIIPGDCIEVMQDIPSDSIDVTFADPPLI